MNDNNASDVNGSERRAARRSLGRRLREALRRLASVRRDPSRESDADARYRHLFDRVPIALYRTAPDGTIIDLNPALAQLLGYPDRTSLLRLSAFDLFADRRARSDQIAHLEAEDLIFGYEVQLRRHDGSLIWALDYARAVRDSNGNVTAYEGALEDITERKRARDDLQRANEKLGAIIKASPLAIIVHDVAGNVVSWNPAAERIFGWSEAEVVGRGLPFVPPEKHHEFLANLRKVTRGESIERSEIQRVRRDGSAVCLSLSAAPLRDAEGEIIGVLAVLADITARRQAEETRQRLAEILEATPDLVAIASVDGKIIYLNPAGRSLLGITDGEQLQSGPIWTLLSERHDSVVRAEALPSAIREGTWSGNVAFRSREGREIPTSMVLIAHRDAGGEADYLSLIARDLTEQEVLEARVRQAQTMDAIGRLAGGIAHDFNNLLTTIIGHSDLLLRHAVDEQTREDITAIKEAGQRAATLTSHLLAFGRRQLLQLRLLDLNEIIAGLAPQLEKMAGDRVELQTVLDRALAHVKADAIQLEEVIRALVENACEAMPDGGKLTIVTANAELSREAAQHLGSEEPGRYVVLTVTDTGHGMDEVTRTRIFEPFFSTKKEVKGTGLGLSTVYGIVKQTGGELWVSSEQGRGTTVKIYLPGHDAPAASQRPRARRATDAGADATILIAEDEPAVLNLAVRVLQARGYTVLAARDGIEALSIQERHSGPIDLLITDVVMPKLDGPELADRLRRGCPQARVIYISGYTDNTRVRELMADKRIAFLQKPFTPSALAGITRRVLAEAPGEDGSQLA
jgi:PAS domain S-box-containing protein